MHFKDEEFETAFLKIIKELAEFRNLMFPDFSSDFKAKTLSEAVYPLWNYELYDPQSLLSRKKQQPKEHVDVLKEVRFINICDGEFYINV